MLNGYTYCKHHMLKSGRRWQCTKSFQKCLAYLIIDHNELLVIDNYTFFKRGTIRNGGSRYTCSCTFSKGCKAYVHVSSDDIILFSNTEHCHEPMNYMKISDGSYIKV
ncbi:hypothetical protein K1T71_006530 [Dendrolimus kikuchii]|uniref:Uncharacterized protein n=1 Tax=Dendrolimus kikuchii TaxID=765133 RepID=A0ACC1D289_9NEOP|nr:hypothetical protein K1T71_006530 [Dendrolimus kikuchii]